MVILVVDDDLSFNELVSRYLTKEGFEVISVYGSRQALDVIGQQRIDLVLADYKLPGMDGLALTEKIQQMYSGIPVILITNYADIRVAVNSIKLGAFEFVSKPVIPDELLKIIHLALSPSEQKSHTVKHTQEEQYIIGKNEKTANLWKHVNIVAPTKMNVLITGESGTGKEHIARTIHQMSRRAKGPFVAVDCGALTVELAGSELFGHMKGAFTGANADKKGLFEEANGGTLFLDEVGNLPYEIQVSLLRAIQEESIKRVGGNKEIKVDVRLVAATNDLLSQSIENNSFRNDLYHRLNEFELFIPPLRERIDDVEEFCDFFVRQACSEFEKQPVSISDEVKQVFMNYSWPGNLRELRNIIRRSVILTSGDEITGDALPIGMKDASEVKSSENVQQPIVSQGSSPNLLNIKDQNREQERRLVLEALEKFKYNKTKAAEALNIDRSTLYKKMKLYEIEI